MKKFYFWYLLTLIIVALLPQAADAQQNRTQQETSSHVTAAQAMDVGYAFMRTGDGSKSGGTQSNAVRKQTMQLVYTGRATDSLTRAVTDCYYVFALQPKGFVIVAADDRVEPILGYSYDNDFVVENMPAHVRSWLGAYEKQIEAVAKSDQEADPAAKDKWMALKLGQPMNRAKNGTTVGPLLTTTWNQGQYYNNLCPADAYGPAGHVYTGCVATAMAQIIHYWGYPTQGRGIHSYSSNYGTLEVNYNSASYDHTLMPNALTSTSSTQEVNAVATLIRDCGVAVNMGYSPEESGSMDQDARAALINFYRFSPDLSYAEKAYFSDDEWETMLRNDLDAGNPVYYSGQGTGGHAFVCDGYNADGYFSFNFGWGGYCNGWYLTSNVNPGGNVYNDSQSAIFGIVPDSTGNVILGQTQGTSTFIVDEPLEFYHLMGHNAYEGCNYDNGCINTIHFVPANNTNQIVADILEFEDQNLSLYDGNGHWLRNLSGGSDNDLSPVVSNHNRLRITYSGNMYYVGFKVNISQTDEDACRMVSYITSFVEATTVHLTWTENGSATQWEIEYGVKDFALGTGTIYTATTNTATFSNLPKFTEYDFYIRSICGTGLYGLRNKVTIMVEAEYWQDIVTSQPAGYVYDAQTNSVEVSTAEGLAWCAKNNATGVSVIKLTADINLSGYKWRPFVLTNTKFDGQGHIISNAYIHESTSDVGLFSTCVGGSIGNLGLTNSQIKGAGGTTGGICGSYSGDIMRNCYISSSVVDGGNGGMVGGLIGGGNVVNCYANAHVIGNHWIGLMVGCGSVKNSYAAGTLSVLSYCNMGGIVAVSGEVSNCYSVWTLKGVVGLPDGPIADTSTFIKTNDGCTLLTPIDFDGVIETDLLSALNRGLVLCNDSLCLTWTADTGNVNGGYPVFGNDHYIVQCQDVSDFSVEQVVVNNNYGVKVSWTENGDATQWRIRYRPQDRPDTAYAFISTTNNPDTIYGIPVGTMYDFNVHATCGTDARSAWSNTQSLFVDIPFWTDIVTTQPTGYVEDANGNVEIYSAEGLAWLSVITNGLHNQPQNSFAGKTVTLKSDIDIDGYRWYPICNANWWVGFSGTFDGQNHSISNIYMNRTSGLFGNVYQGSIKNVRLNGGIVIHGSAGLIGSATNCPEISNCHTSVTIQGGNGPDDSGNGSLCGQIYNEGFSKITISNCSSTGTVKGDITYLSGDNACGSLIGYVYTDDRFGEIEIRNCYATGDAYGERYVGGLIGYIRGAKIYNCFSTGHVEFCPSYSLFCGSVIGCQDLDAGGAYIYGQDNVNTGVALIGLDGNYPNTALFHHEGETNTLLSSVSINGETPNNLLDALNAWVISQNDPTLRLWTLDSITGYPVFGDYFVPSCYNPSDLTVSQATVVGDGTIKTRLGWTQEGNPDHWEVLYVANGHSIDSGNIVSTNSNPFVLVGIPTGNPLDFYVRAVCGEDGTSNWCGPVTYIPDILHWTDVVTTKPEGFQRDADGNIYISSAEGLSWLSSVTNGLNGAQEDNIYEKQIFLTNDIDLSAYRWTPITLYVLSLNGNNHVVSGLYCNELAGCQGLVGSMNWGTISNIVLTQCNVIGKRANSGGIVGYALGNIVNCMVTGSVRGGGIVGRHDGHPPYSFNVENCCFIGNDNIDGNPVGISEASAFAGVVNCYVVNPPNRYYIGESGNSDFTGSGLNWTLTTPPYINGAFHSDLVDILNTWVDANNTDGQYLRWTADTNMVNGGYPIFESVSIPAVTTHDTVVAQGYYCWHGMVFTSDTVVADTLYTYNGYDSVVTYHILVNPATITEITVDTCSSYIWNGLTYSKTGDYVQTFSTAVNDADSVAILHLTINRLYGVDVQHVCGNSYTWIDGVTYIADNNTSKFLVTTEGGCDSLVTLQLTFGHNTSSDTTAVACNSFDWYEQTNLTQSGDYIRTLTNASGCDSVVTLHLTINQLTAGIDELTACDSLVWIDGITYTESNNTATYMLTNAAGCDSVVTLHLTVNYSNIGDTTVVACDNFDWYEQTNLTQSGDYTRILTNANGCDSVVTLHLTINHSTSSDTTAVACNSFDWYEQTNLTQSGDYTRTLTNASGCDSVITLHLTINQSTTGVDELTACDSLVWIDGITYTESNNTATYILTNAAGCDSVVTLHLTVNYSNTGDTTAVACESFDWYEHLNLVQNGDYTHTFTNASGCDSVVTLHLTINHSSYSDTTAVACNSFDWYEQTNLTQSGDYSRILTNANGCDSVVTLHLTINYSTSSDTTAVVCDSFDWYGVQLTQSGEYTHTFTNSAGCDSTVTLHLTINQPVTTTSTATICDSELPYEWNGVTFNEAGTQNLTLQAMNGCDSTVEMNLTVTPSVTIDAYLTISDNDLPFTYGDTTFMPGTVQSGDYTFNFTTADGCDSIIILHLTVETGISSYDLNARMKVYPNPTKDVVNVQLTINNEQLDDVEVQLFDVYGRLLEVVNMADARGASLQTTQIDLSHYAKGVYFLKAVGDRKTIAVRKLVKD